MHHHDEARLSLTPRLPSPLRSIQAAKEEA